MSLKDIILKRINNIKENNIFDINNITPKPNSSFSQEHIKDNLYININFNSNTNKEELSFYKNLDKAKLFRIYNKKSKSQFYNEENQDIDLLS